MSLPPELANDVDAVAADWVVRGFGDDMGADDMDALAAWLEAAGSHRDAYDRALLAWGDLSDAAPVETVTTLPAETALAHQLSGHLLSIQAGRTRRQGRQRLWMGGGAMAAAVAGLALVMVVPKMQAPIVYATAKGERKVVHLADGSTLSLNTDTRVTVRLTGAARQLVLDHGEVGLNVVHDATRPLHLVAGDVTLTDLGTQFNVRHTDGGVTVAVTEGSVQMEAASHMPLVVLRRGDEAVRYDGATRMRVSQVDPEQVFAWKSAHAIYRDQPLSAVVRDLNRYFTTPIYVDKRAGELRMTAMLTLDSETSVVSRLQDYLPLQVETTGQAIILHRADRPQPAQP